MTRHGGQVLVEQLKLNGATRVFSVPGESFLAVLDGLIDSGIENIVCRQEGGAAMMAEASGKLTGRPGIALVTRGPGASNASSAVHIAAQDSTPLILFVGQIAREHKDREAFQEVDYRQFFGGMAKWVAEVENTDRLPEYVNRAFKVAVSGRPGPVVIALPEDVLSAPCSAKPLPVSPPPVAGVNEDQVAMILEALNRARKPLLVAGGSGWSQQAADDLQRFAENWTLPVAVSFRRQDHMDNDSPSYAGDLSVGANPQLRAKLAEADLVVALGTRLGDIATDSYQNPPLDHPGTALVHVYPDPDLPGSVYPVKASIIAPAAEAISALVKCPAPAQVSWGGWTADIRAGYETWQKPKETPGKVKMEQIIRWLSASLPPDAVVTNGAGNYAAFLHRYYRFRRFGTQLAPTSGSMGYGLPAAIAAKLHHRDRTVVCLAGDGCFQMTLNELSTAAQHGANIIAVVANNGRYGTIRMHQERTYPARVSGTDLANPDFVALARAYGGHGELVERTEDFAPAFLRAQQAGCLAIIELRLDPEALSTGMTLGETRASGQKAGR